MFDQQIMANGETNDEAFDAALEEAFEMVMKEPTKETIEETKETIHETCEEITAKAPVRLKITILADVYYRFRHPVFTLIEYLGVVVNIIHIDSATLHLNPVVEFYNTDLKGFYGISFCELSPSMTLPVLIDETFRPKLNVYTECSRICNYLATEAIVEPVSCGLLQANTLVPPENSKNRGLYDTQMSWILTHFSPKAALAVERLELLRRDRSRTDVKIGPADRKFHNNYKQLKTELDALEFFLWKGPVFLCEEFTMLDILCIPYMTELASPSYYDVRKLRPNLRLWWQNVVDHLTSKNVKMGPITFFGDHE